MKTSIPVTAVRKRREGGVILLLGVFCMPVIMGMLGISIDLSILYSVKARLQMACDGAAMAALRSLSLGQTISSQTTAATAVANNWFQANFSNGFMGTTNTSNPPTVAISQSNVTQLTTVDITASTTIPSYFMKYWNTGSSVITANSQTSRRNVVVTLVLDRSGSMTNVNNSYNGLTPCQAMVAAAKLFTGMFQPTRDYIGLVTFAGSVNVASSPGTNFQSTLGYTNSAGSGTGLLDSIVCQGGTNTPTAISIGWNENYKIQLPGALNVIVLMTDGQPTAATYNFVTTAAKDPSGSAQSAVDASASNCKDSTGKALSAGGNMVLHTTNWVGSREQTSGQTNAVSLGANSYSGWSPISGPMGTLYSDNSGFYGIWPFFSPTSSLLELVGRNSTESPGCAFATGNYWEDPSIDIAWIPEYDIFGNATSGYNSISQTASQGGKPRYDMTRSNFYTAILNLTDNAANFARSNHYLPNGSTAYGGNLIFTVGLGGNGGVDHTLLQRIANDPNQSPDGGATYSAYAGYNSNQPVGTYIYSANSSDLAAAFQKIASQILRISK